jgi:hypothetical protein
MSIEEKNAHINMCIEGKGQEHIHNYNNSLNVISKHNKEIIADIPKANVKKDLKYIEKYQSYFTENIDYEKCPICSKIFTVKTIKIKHNHIIDCLRQRDEEEVYNNKKRRLTKSVNY